MNRTSRALLGLALLAGCAGTETGNPTFALVAVAAHSSDPDHVSIRDARGAVVIEEAWIDIGRIGLVPEGACADAADATRGEALGVADHAGAEVAFIEVELDASRYCGLVLELSRAGAVPVGAPPELVDHSVVIVGRLADGTPLRIVGAFEGDAPVAADAGSFELDETQRALLLGVDVSAWIGELDLAAATRAPDGSIVLDDTRNTALRDAFDARLQGSLELFRDADEDGALDAMPVRIGRGAP